MLAVACEKREHARAALWYFVTEEEQAVAVAVPLPNAQMPTQTTNSKDAEGE